MSTPIHAPGATLTRRRFVQAGGSLVVGFGLVGRELFEVTANAATAKNSLDASRSTSWFEIHADNTIVMRTGKVDFGQSTAHTAYKQIVAEELNVPYRAITSVVMGDTDRTPDGGFSAGFLEYGGQNLRKAAAYTYQAILDLAATTLRVRQEPAHREGRRHLRRRPTPDVRRARQRPGPEAHDSRRRRSDDDVRPDRRRQPSDEADESVHHHRQVVRERGHAGQGDGQGAVGHQRSPAQHAARPRRAPENARVHADFSGHARQDAIPHREGGREGQPGRCGRVHGMGSGQGRTECSRAARSGPSGRACPETPRFTNGCATRRTGRRRPSPKATRTKAPRLRRSARRPGR